MKTGLSTSFNGSLTGVSRAVTGNLGANLGGSLVGNAAYSAVGGISAIASMTAPTIGYDYSKMTPTDFDDETKCPTPMVSTTGRMASFAKPRSKRSSVLLPQ